MTKTFYMAVAICTALTFTSKPMMASEVKVPVLELKRCEVPPVIDGKLDDTCWQGASSIDQWFRVSVDNTLTRNKSQQAWVCSDDQWLYIAFKINHPLPSSIVPQATEHDGRVQIENCVKIIFDPGTKFNPWYIFRLSAGNVKAEQRNINVNEKHQKGWDIPWRSQTRLTEHGWNAEIAIPLYALYEAGEIDDGQTRFDLIVNAIEPIDNNPANMKKVLYSWSPVQFRYWNIPQRFGILKGLKKAQIKAPFLPQLKKVSITDGYQRSADNQTFYTLSTVVNALTGQAGSVIIQIKDMPVGSKAVIITKELTLSGGETKHIEFKIPVKDFGKRDIQVSLISPKAKEIWQQIDIKDPEKLKVLSAYSRMSYYTSEKSAQIVCDISLDNAILAQMRLKVLDEAGKVLATADGVSKHYILKVPADKLQLGATPVTLQLENSSGLLFGVLKLDIRKLPPNPSREVKIDYLNSSISKAGKTFVPFGVWGVPPSLEYFTAMDKAHMNSAFAIKSVDKQYFKDANDNNINLIVSPYRFTGNIELNISDIVKGKMKDTLDSLVKGIPTLTYDSKNDLLKARPFEPLHFRLPVLRQKLGANIASDLYNTFSLAQMDNYSKVVNTCKNNPATLCYMIFDEPPIPLLSEEVAGLAMYKEYQKLDPYHPSLVNYCGLPPEVPQATSFADIICVDSYGEGVHDHFNVVYKIAKRCRLEKKLSWLILKAERVGLRMLSLAEQNAQLYACVIAGARGFFYFNFPILSRRMWSNIATLSEDIKRLQPFLTSQPLDYHVDYSPGDYSLDAGRLPDVVAGIFKSDAGHYLLLLVNCMDYPVDIEMTLPFAIKDSKLEATLRHDALKLAGNTLKERLEIYGVRGYLIDDNSIARVLDANSFKLKLKMTPHKELQAPPIKPLNRFSGDKKNLIANSSLENTRFPGWPDYFYPWHLGRAELEEKFQLDTDNPFHGKQALKMTAEKGRSFGFYILQGADGGMKSDPYWGDPNIEYTLSVYMRGTGAKISMKSEKQKGRTMGMMTKGHVTDIITPPEKWTRYSWKITMPTILWFDIISPGSVWIDAFQLEKSDSPTTYEP